ncbi:MAG: hypothetical protein BWY59_01382 [Verrucomicrobia bacterium ADurb.Bin345]|nr:MAG: hypothetical protein BWY59_01382 [Verrucomicrobia bacterium ADurb.Bin345]
MVAGDDDPLVALVHQHINEVPGVSHLRREETFRVITEIRIAVPRLPPRLLEDLKFLAEHFLREQRRERVMIRESDEVEPAPASRLAIAVRPPAAVSEVSAAAQLANVVDQRSGIAQREPAARERGQRRARPALVSVPAIVQSEDVPEIVFGMVVRADAAVVLPRLEHDGIPRILPARRLVAVAVPLRPIERLVVVPEAGHMHVAIARRNRRRQEQECRACDEGFFSAGVAACHFCTCVCTNPLP